MFSASRREAIMPDRTARTATDSRGRPLLHGCGTALVTPFERDGSVDEDALKRLVEWQISEGVHFLVPCASPGEAASLTLAAPRPVLGRAGATLRRPATAC